MSPTGQPPLFLNRRSSSVTRGSCDRLIVTPLGGGNEPGRSCVYMSYMGKTVLFDCGIHPAYCGLASLPYFDTIDPSTIDLVLVTNFHSDHAAALPYFLEMQSKFKGRVFMTHPTKAIYSLLLSDYVKVMNTAIEDMLCDGQDIVPSMDRIEVIDFHQTMEVNGIRFSCHPAGNVLGSAMFMVKIAGVSVVYTGDFSFEKGRHLRAAEIPQWFCCPDACIIGSTYGTQLREPRHIREKRLTDVIHSTVAQGGCVLIPTSALGPALELLLLLDEYWSNHPELHNVPIYHASRLAKRCMSIYRTYANAMNDRFQSQFAANSSNPFELKHLSSLENFGFRPCVVMASPSGLQSGLSRKFFDMWCCDKKNACVILECAVEGTLAKTIINKPKEVTLMNGRTAPLNMHVHYMPSFSGHADFAETSGFLKKLTPTNIILVHGEPKEMGRLQHNLIPMFDPYTKIFSPYNCQPVDMDLKLELRGNGSEIQNGNTDQGRRHVIACGVT